LFDVAARPANHKCMCHEYMGVSGVSSVWRACASMSCPQRGSLCLLIECGRLAALALRIMLAALAGEPAEAEASAGSMFRSSGRMHCPNLSCMYSSIEFRSACAGNKKLLASCRPVVGLMELPLSHSSIAALS